MANVEIYGDIHFDDERAELIQEAIEHQQPDAVFQEGFYDVHDFTVQSVKNYGTAEKIYNGLNIDSEKRHENDELIAKPIYELSESEFEQTLGELSRVIERDVDTIAEVPEKAKEPVNSLLYHKNDLESETHNVLTRMIHLSSDYGFNLHSVDKDEDFKYAANEFGNLPNDPNIVQNIVKSVMESDRENLETIANNHNLKMNELQEGLQNYAELRKSDKNDQIMADNIENTVKEQGYENIGVVTGEDHVAGIDRELPEEWEVNTIEDHLGYCMNSLE